MEKGKKSDHKKKGTLVVLDEKRTTSNCRGETDRHRKKQ